MPLDPPASANSRIARLSAWVAILTGAAVLLGWLLQIDVLKSVVPRAVPMKANTALALLLGGFALWLHTRARAGAAAVATVAAACIGALGVATLLQYLGLDLGVDELLFLDDTLGANAAPGRMSPFSAL